jgi:glycosidase
MQPRYPSLFQINTRVLMTELSAKLKRPATLDDISDEQIDRWKEQGFDVIWFLGVWQTGPAAQKVSASKSEWLTEYKHVLPDFQPSDVCGSCFAIREYKVHKDFGGKQALVRLRKRLSSHGLRLILDFVPNHMAPDHPWVNKHPDYFVSGTEELLQQQPQNYCRAGDRIFAYGRDPYFDGWPDTLQLNYGNSNLQEAMAEELRKIAALCDGVRCDMAMLVLPEVFQRTWSISTQPFWPRVTQQIHEQHPGFLFLAEVYWDLEWTLQQQGFDYTYDKRLYDRLKEQSVQHIREHFFAGLDFQNKLARFLENHDEPRAAATFPPQTHKAAAIIAFLCPGLRFFHQGQFEAKKVKIPVHLGRGPAEVADEDVANFYGSLLQILKDPVFREGEWKLLDCRSAWEGNWTSDCFVAYAWIKEKECRLVVINYSDHASQCYVGLPCENLAGRMVRLQDKMSAVVYDRGGNELLSRGLYLDMPAWSYHVFSL